MAARSVAFVWRCRYCGKEGRTATRLLPPGWAADRGVESCTECTTELREAKAAIAAAKERFAKISRVQCPGCGEYGAASATGVVGHWRCVAPDSAHCGVCGTKYVHLDSDGRLKRHLTYGKWDKVKDRTVGRHWCNNTAPTLVDNDDE